jgi:hypothetical protein
MAARRWTMVAAVTGALAWHAPSAGAQEPVPTPTPTPTPTPVPVPIPTPPAVAGTVVYIITVTTTTTTTAINAPITWVAAPITTNVNNASTTNGTTATNVNNTSAATTTPATGTTNGAANPGGGQTELSLRGCTRRARGRATRKDAAIQTARIRVPSDAQLVVNVNGKPVGNLRLDSGARRARNIPLRVKLAADGVLTVHRPSGRILRVQACTPR